MKAIINRMMDTVVITDLEGRITQFNKALTESFGWGKEVIGELPTIFVAKRDIPKVMDGIKECIEKGYIRNLEFSGVTKEKKEVPVLLNVTLMKNSKGNPVGMVATARDITELKRLQEEKEKANTKRTEELEKFAKVAVGRELKMVELKKRIKELESKLKEIMGNR